MKRLLLVIIYSLIYSTIVLAHSSFIQHCEDMMDVFGFEYNLKLFSRSKDTKSNKSWTKFISSDMIDNTEFHRQLERRHPKFHIANPNYHRMLFHWGYNVEPWSPYLERHIRTYCRLNNIDKESTISAFKAEIKAEQKKRNRKINEVTENVFGFAHGGKDAKYAQFFASMAYNIHLLGDQQRGNKVFIGVAHTNNLIEQIILSLRMLDSSKSKPIEKGLTLLNKKYSDQHLKADAVMLYLKQTIPGFIKTAQNGSIYRRLEKNGFKIK